MNPISFNTVHDPDLNIQPTAIDSSNDKLISIVSGAIEKKKEKKDQKFNNKFERYHPGMIGGDGLTMTYTAFTGMQYFIPSLQTMSWVGWVTSGAGEIGGAINIWVAFQEFKEAYTAFKNNDKLNGWKMVFDATFFTLIGVLMILVSLAIKVGALGAVGAFFVTNPWLLPVLFFVITIPLLLEIGYRVSNIALKKDLASKLNLTALKDAIEKKDKNTALNIFSQGETPFSGLFTVGGNLLDVASDDTVRARMRQLEGHIGEGAKEIVKLFEMIIKDWTEEDLLRQLKIAKEQLEIAKRAIADKEDDLSQHKLQAIRDWESQFNLDAIIKKLETDENDKVDKAFNLIIRTPLASPLIVTRALSHKMEILQADMGVEAAIEVFDLFEKIISNSQSQESVVQLEKVQQKITEWNHAQYVRLFQQILYVLAFVISMGALAPGANANMINGSDNMAMAAANLIPLFMDLFWPFKRNVPLVVENIFMNRLQNPSPSFLGA